MSSIAQASSAMEHILKGVAKAIERETGFVQRSTAQLDGPGFAQMAVWTWVDTPDASYSQMQQVAASLGVSVSVQAIAQRFGKESVTFMQRLLHEAVGEVLCSDARVPELLSRFNGVYVQDGTVISLPGSLTQPWRLDGRGGSEHQVRLDLARGGMQGPWLQEGRASERSGEAHETPLPPGSLYDVDGGYFTLGEMRGRGEAGEFWLTTPQASTLLYDQRGQCWNLASFLQQQGQQVDVQVSLGKRERLPVRLLAIRVPPAQAQRRRQQANSTVEGKGIVRPKEPNVCGSASARKRDPLACRCWSGRS